MQKLHTSILINTPREKVRDTILGTDTYGEQIKAFDPDTGLYISTQTKPCGAGLCYTHLDTHGRYFVSGAILTYMYIAYFSIFVGLVILWSVWGYFSSHVEHMDYTVVESKKDYEIRLYPEHIVAQTTVTGSYKEALNEGFRIIAGYIFGGNEKKERIAMTAPVTETVPTSEPIAMTVPVTSTLEGASHTITFGMPQSYTLATLPTPTDSRVHIVTVPEKKMAVVRFGWVRTEARVQSKKQELLDMLKQDNITVIGEPEYAGYNAPWTPPWMSRNEVFVEVR